MERLGVHAWLPKSANLFPESYFDEDHTKTIHIVRAMELLCWLRHLIIRMPIKIGGGADVVLGDFTWVFWSGEREAAQKGLLNVRLTLSMEAYNTLTFDFTMQPASKVHVCNRVRQACC